MHRPTVSALCATGLALLAACQDHPTRPVGPPSALISDGRVLYGGNKDFLILPPLLPDPSTDENFDAGKFNPDLLPEVVICLVDTSTEMCHETQPTITYTSTSGPGSETVRLSNEHYIVNIHVPDLDQLVAGTRYRIQVFVGSTRLGFADFIPESSMSEVKSVTTNEVIGLLDKRTLPFKFRIEDGAVCYPADTETCNSKTIDLGAKNNTVVLEATGDRIDIPQQSFNQVTTVTLQLCDGDIDVDSPKYGHCLRVTADPPLQDILNPRATVSMCSVSLDEVPLPDDPNQEDLITMYRQDNGAIFALPHADDFCGEPSLNSAPTNWLRQFAHVVRGLLAPRPLYATTATAVLDVGEAGETETFSDFQLVLPAQMFPADGADEISGPAGGEASPVPAVVMMDAADTPQPVAGALVTFRVTGGGGNFGTDEGEDPITEVQVLSDENGRAEVPVWILGDGEATNRVTASGRGFAGPTDDGPFMPEIHCPVGEEEPCQETVQLPDPLDDRKVVVTASIVELSDVIDFETFPDESPACASCALTNQFAARGVVFSFETVSSFEDCPTLTNAQVFLSTVYDPTSDPANHSATVAQNTGPGGGFCLGIVKMALADLPTTVTFRARGNNSIAVFPVSAVDGSGSAIPSSQITRTDMSTYTPGGGAFVGRQETVTITNAAGIGRVDLIMNTSFFYLLDNLAMRP